MEKAPVFDDNPLFWQAAYRARVEGALKKTLSNTANAAADLLEAMRYGASGGKRWRALLTYATAAAINGGLTEKLDEIADAPAVALELIHAYSLIHDDLPCMDNDDMRRGQPSCHVRFGEALALLAGDALQSAAFSVLAKSALIDPAKACAVLADAIGVGGMAGGQAIDIAHEGAWLGNNGNTAEHLSAQLMALETMHGMKTGALIRASIALGMMCGTPPAPAIERNLTLFGERVGLAFQVADDILDATASTATLGKTAGKDADQNKMTYVTLLGLEGAKRQLNLLRDDLCNLTQSLGKNAAMLRALADTLLNRAR